MGRRALALAIVAAQTIGCGAEVPHGGAVDPTTAPHIVKSRLEATDLIARDLELVVRVDVGRIGSELGPDLMGRLRARALEAPSVEGDPIAPWLAHAMAHAEIVWIGVRLDASGGADRVLVAEGRIPPYPLVSGQLAATPSGVADVSVLDRRGPLARADLARVVTVRDRLVAFASAVEMDGSLRALTSGRGDEPLEPAAEGLLSFDAASLHLPPPYDTRFPALARALRHVDRARGVVSASDRALRLETELRAKTPEGAVVLAKLFEALRDEPADDGGPTLLAGAQIEREERLVRVAWTVPGWLVASLFEGGTPLQ